MTTDIQYKTQHKAHIYSSMAADLGEKLSVITDHELTPFVQTEINHIIPRLYDLISRRLRVAIANNMASFENTPRQLEQHLLHDDDYNVAVPLILHSPRLKLQDIEALLAKAGDETATALATRPDLTDKHMLKIAYMGVRQASNNLAINPHIILSEQALNLLVKQDLSSDAADALLLRKELPIELIWPLTQHAAYNIIRYLSHVTNVNQDMLKDLVTRSLTQFRHQSVALRAALMPHPRNLIRDYRLQRSVSLIYRLTQETGLAPELVSSFLKRQKAVQIAILYKAINWTVQDLNDTVAPFDARKQEDALFFFNVLTKQKAQGVLYQWINMTSSHPT